MMISAFYQHANILLKIKARIAMLEPHYLPYDANAESRFLGFCDSNLEAIHLQLDPAVAPRSLLLQIFTRDFHAPVDPETGRHPYGTIVSLRLNNVVEYRMTKNRRHDDIRWGDGIYVLPLGDELAIDFGGSRLYDLPPTLDELRLSHFYAIGQSLEYCVLESPE